MGNFSLAPKAKLDLLDIFLYGLEFFGLEQSEHFQDELNEQFQVIANFPLHFQAVDDIYPGYR